MSAPDPAPEAEEPVFAAPWEAKAFALVHALHARGLFAWPEWTAALAHEIAAHCEGAGGYELWLDALEDLLVEKGVASAAEMARVKAAWAAAAAATPHGSAIELPDDV